MDFSLASFAMTLALCSGLAGVTAGAIMVATFSRKRGKHS